MGKRPAPLQGASRALTLLAYVAVAVAWSAPASLAPATTVPDLGDPLHLAWVLAWDAHQFVRDPLSLFDSNSFHPHPRSLTFSDHLLPEAILVAPVFWLSGNAVLASNAAVVVGLVLSALAMDLLVRHVTGSRAAAFLSGLVYAFNSFTLHEQVRVHVLHMQWWPLALLFLLRFARGGRARDAAGLAAALLMQGLSGTYYLAYTALLVPLWLPLAYAGLGRRPGRAELWRLAAPFAAAVLVAALVLGPYWVQFRELGVEKGWTGGADALAYLEPAAGNRLWGFFDLPGGEPEVPHFMGFAALALALLGCARLWTAREDRVGAAAGWVALVTGAVGLALSLGPVIHVGGHGLVTGPYYWLYEMVPLSRAMASPERVGVLVGFALALLAGQGAAALLVRRGAAARGAIVGSLALLLPLEHWSPPRRAAPVPSGAEVPAVYHWLAREGEGPVAEVPLHPLRSRRLWAAYLYFSTYHWRPVPIGRASFYPPGHDHLAWYLRGFPDETSLTLLDRLGLRTVVVHPRTWTLDERRERLAAIESEARLFPVRAFNDTVPSAHAVLGLGEERVFRLREGPPPRPPCRPVDEVAREGWTLSSTGINKPERAADGDRQTAWLTARPQRPRDYLEVRLPRPETLAAVALDAGYPYDEFPRHLVLMLAEGGGPPGRAPWADGPEERWALLADLVRRPAEAQTVLRFEPRTVTGVRLMIGLQEADDAWPRWSVPELRLYRGCR